MHSSVALLQHLDKPHSFFFGRIPVVLENRKSSQGGGGGVRTSCTLPLDPPLFFWLVTQSSLTGTRDEILRTSAW